MRTPCLGRVGGNHPGTMPLEIRRLPSHIRSTQPRGLHHMDHARNKSRRHISTNPITTSDRRGPEHRSNSSTTKRTGHSAKRLRHKTASPEASFRQGKQGQKRHTFSPRKQNSGTGRTGGSAEQSIRSPPGGKSKAYSGPPVPLFRSLYEQLR
jgi:hypothetical protein